jgi:4-amino-4-deoxy-L-arabinose transferase-like glycosyltransferase
VLLYLGAVKLVSHLLFNGRYGFFRDELYNIICGERLAFGYVDHPPLTPLVARLSRLVFGESLFGLRLLPALAGAATVVLAGLIARKLGGGRFAQFLAGLSVILSGVLLNFGHMLTNNAFDLLFWVLASYVLILIIKEDRPRLWLVFGLVAGLALQNKYSIALFVAAAGVGLLLSPARKRLWNVWPLMGAAVALVIFLPNLVWQARHGFPFVELNRNAVAMKNAPLSPLQFLGGAAMDAIPPVFLLVLAGAILFLVAPGLRAYRAFGWAFFVLLAFFALSGGKPYYLSPVYPAMLAAGAWGIERASLSLSRRWIRPASVVLLIATSAVGIPFALPVLRVDAFIAYSRALGLAPVQAERQEVGALPQHYADQFGWPELTEVVAGVYRGLSEAERADCVIFAQNYGEASALNVFGRRFGLPPAVCLHNNYWLWGPGEKPGSILIAVGGDKDDYLELYADVAEAARFENVYVMPYENNLSVFVCRGLNRPLKDVWLRNKHFI